MISLAFGCFSSENNKIEIMCVLTYVYVIVTCIFFLLTYLLAFFEAQSCCIIQEGLRLIVIPLPQSPNFCASENTGMKKE